MLNREKVQACYFDNTLLGKRSQEDDQIQDRVVIQYLTEGGPIKVTNWIGRQKIQSITIVLDSPR